MKRIFSLSILLGLMLAGASAQQSSLTLTFSATNNTDWVRLDSTRITNRTRNCDTVLYYPDTVLALNYTFVLPEPHYSQGKLLVFQNYPNPATDHTIIEIFVPGKDKVNISVSDVTGRIILQDEKTLDFGIHSFRLYPGNDHLYILTARWKEYSGSIKILFSTLNNSGTCSLVYLGQSSSTIDLYSKNEQIQFMISPGDDILFKGYNAEMKSAILDSPENSKTYTFQFATNIPCPGMSSVEYEGQVYNTIQVLSQCWLKENLNVGEMINGTMEQSNNGTIEKYCYNNEPDSCSKHGGFYQWNEMMQYVTEEMNRGICPPGWHLPTDEEWKLLEGAADSQYGIGDPVWNNWGWRGADAGYRLSKDFSSYCSGSDEFGFGVNPTGMREEIGIHNGDWFHSFGSSGYYWSTTQNTENSSKIYHYFPCIINGAARGVWMVPAGMSVRCLRDQ
jgi:uncharacterized protein (TIGR02145 family)